MADPVDREPDGAPTAEEGDGASIARNTTIVSGFLLLGRFVGMFREVIISRFIGTTAVADAFRFANETILQDLYTKIEKLLQPIYMPIFVARQRQDGDDAAFGFVNAVGTLLTGLLLAIAALGALFAPHLLSLVAGGNEALRPGSPGFALAVYFIRLFLPALVIYSVSNLAELTIQGYKHFTIPALAEAVRRVLLVAAIAAAVVVYHRPTEHQATQALAWGVVVGCLARLLIMVPKLWVHRHRIRPTRRLWTPDTQKALTLALPLFLGIAFAYGRNLLEAYYALGEGEGMFSALKYARKLVDMPWQVLSLGLSYVIYPFLSELGAKADRARMANALVRVIRVMVFVFAPITVFFIVAGEPVIRVAFFGGKFDDQSVAMTQMALPYYVLGLVFFAIEDPLLKWFYAMSDTKTPIALGIFADLVWFVVAILGVRELGLGLAALAAAMTLAKAIKVVVVVLILRRRLGMFPLAPLVPFAGKVALSCAAMGALMLAALRVLGPMVPLHGLPKQAALLALTSGLGAIVFAGGCAVLRVEELQLVASKVRGKLRRSAA